MEAYGENINNSTIKDVSTLPTSGIVLIDKPEGVTSFDVVAQLRHTLHIKKIGHAGTLDPFASGLLICGYGNATRLLPYLSDQLKTYEATIRLGTCSDTDDRDGTINVQDSLARKYVVQLDTSIKNGSFSTILKDIIKNNFLGNIKQVPSQYSAVRIHGKHAYELARKGQKVDIDPRSITIAGFDVEKYQIIDHNAEIFCDVDVKITCSSGTYIRAIGRDLGKILQTGAYVTHLRRTRIGEFDSAHALVGRAACVKKMLRNGTEKVVHRIYWRDNSFEKYVYSCAYAVQHSMAWWSIDEHDMQDLRHGRKIVVDSQRRHLPYVDNEKNDNPCNRRYHFDDGRGNVKNSKKTFIEAALFDRYVDQRYVNQQCADYEHRDHERRNHNSDDMEIGMHDSTHYYHGNHLDLVALVSVNEIREGEESIPITKSEVYRNNDACRNNNNNNRICHDVIINEKTDKKFELRPQIVFHE